MITVISFNEGCSGHFLAAMLTDSTITEFLQIDHQDNQLSHAFLGKHNFYPGQSIKPDYQVYTTHESDSTKIKNFFNSEVSIISIRPVTGLFTAIYNVFLKKHTKITLSTNNSYDLTLEHIKDYFNKFTNANYPKDSVEFNFGWIYDANRLSKFVEEQGHKFNSEMHRCYLANQLPLLLDYPREPTSMQSIIAIIPDEYYLRSPWFAAYSIFCYEMCNNLREEQRRWSINDFTFLSKVDLINLSEKYYAY